MGRGFTGKERLPSLAVLSRHPDDGVDAKPAVALPTKDPPGGLPLEEAVATKVRENPALRRGWPPLLIVWLPIAESRGFRDARSGGMTIHE